MGGMFLKWWIIDCRGCWGSILDDENCMEMNMKHELLCECLAM